MHDHSDMSDFQVVILVILLLTVAVTAATISVISQAVVICFFWSSNFGWIVQMNALHAVIISILMHLIVLWMLFTMEEYEARIQFEKEKQAPTVQTNS